MLVGFCYGEGVCMKDSRDQTLDDFSYEEFMKLLEKIFEVIPGSKRYIQCAICRDVLLIGHENNCSCGNLRNIFYIISNKHSKPS